jgi:hypothetical protein
MQNRPKWRHEIERANHTLQVGVVCKVGSLARKIIITHRLQNRICWN